MPLKNGRLTQLERGIAAAMAETGTTALAAHRTKASESAVQKALQRPAVLAEIGRRYNELLFTDILPLAIAAHKRILSDPRAPAGAVVQAVKLAYDRTLGSEDGARPKEPHELTPEELAESIATLERIAADRAQLVGADRAQLERPRLDIFG